MFRNKNLQRISVTILAILGCLQVRSSQQSRIYYSTLSARTLYFLYLIRNSSQSFRRTRSTILNSYAFALSELLVLTLSTRYSYSRTPSAQLCRLLSVSARLFSGPRVQIILNLYYPSSLDYRTYLLISSFVIVKNVRFLQSE